MSLLNTRVLTVSEWLTSGLEQQMELASYREAIADSLFGTYTRDRQHISVRQYYRIGTSHVPFCRH